MPMSDSQKLSRFCRAMGVPGSQFYASHNKTKAKTIVLLTQLDNGRAGVYYPVSAIYKMSGSSYVYLRGRIPYWYKWHLLCRKWSIMPNGRVIATYRVSKGGRDYISTMPADFAQTILGELGHHRVRLLSGQFK